MEPHHHHEHSHRLTSLNKAFIIGIALNITFVIVEFGVGSVSYTHLDEPCLVPVQ